MPRPRKTVPVETDLIKRLIDALDRNTRALEAVEAPGSASRAMRRQAIEGIQEGDLGPFNTMLLRGRGKVVPIKR